MKSLRCVGRAWIVAANLSLLGLSGCASSAPAPKEGSGRADPTPAEGTAPRADIQVTIDEFLRDPSNGDPQKITAFARESPAVLVVFRPSILHAEGAPDALRALMLAAFTAGNVRAQLEARKKEDMPVAGVRAMVTVYKWLQAKKPDLRVELYETYAAKEAEGKLDAFVTERARK